MIEEECQLLSCSSLVAFKSVFGLSTQLTFSKARKGILLDPTYVKGLGTDFPNIVNQLHNQLYDMAEHI